MYRLDWPRGGSKWTSRWIRGNSGREGFFGKWQTNAIIVGKLGG